MITYTIQKAYNADKQYVEGKCLSSDAKPTENIANGSLMMEMDTSTLYFFDEVNSIWRAWS